MHCRMLPNPKAKCMHSTSAQPPSAERQSLQIMSGKTCSLQGFRSRGGGDPKTGQAGGLPWNFCCRAPDLQIERHVMKECLFAICSGRDCHYWVGHRKRDHLQEPAGGESTIHSRADDMFIMIYHDGISERVAFGDRVGDCCQLV